MFQSGLDGVRLVGPLPDINNLSDSNMDFPHRDVTLSFLENNHEETRIVSNLHPMGDIAVGGYLVCLSIATFVLNILVLVTLARQPKTLTSLQLQLGNLSLCGLATCCFSYPFPTLSSFNHGWAFGEQACQVDACVVYTFALVVIAQLAVIALIRYYTTCTAGQDGNLSQPWLGVSLAGPYCFAMGWALPPLFGWGGYAIESAQLTCSLDWAAMTPHYVTSVFMGTFVLPLGVMVFCYFHMTRYLFNMQSQMNRRRRRLDLHMAKMTATMCLCFLTTWTPYAVVSFYCACTHSNAVNPYLSIVTILIAKTSTICNPVVYFWAIKRFRKDASIAVCFWNTQTQWLKFQLRPRLDSQRTTSSGSGSCANPSPEPATLHTFFPANDAYL